MPKWELRTEGCAIPLARDVESGVWIGHSEVAEYFIHHHNVDIDALTAERDRLAAENAELKSTDHYQRSLDEMHLRYNVEAALAATNATLDKLREAVPEGALCYCYECEAFVVGGEIRRSYNKRCPHCEAEDLTDFAHELQAILYPPETTNDDQI